MRPETGGNMAPAATIPESGGSVKEKEKLGGRGPTMEPKELHI